MSNENRVSQVLDAEARLLRAMLASDAAALDALLHDDLLFNGPTGETATKAVDLANYRSGTITLRKAEASDLRTSQVGDDWKVIAGSVIPLATPA